MSTEDAANNVVNTSTLLPDDSDPFRDSLQRSPTDILAEIDRDLQTKWRRIHGLQVTYLGVSRLLTLEPVVFNGQLQSLNDRFQQFNSTCMAFMRELDDVSDSLEPTLVACVDSIAMRSDWWENTNILSSGISTEIKEKLMQARPPTDPSSYAQYLRAQLRYIDQLQKEDNFTWAKVNQKIITELRRVKNMPCGAIPAFHVALDYVLLVFHEKHIRVPMNSMMKTRIQVLTHIMSEILNELPETFSAGSPFLHLAESTRRIRTRMLAGKCTASSSVHDCAHTALLLPLRTIQERAWKQVRNATYLAVERVLPTELVELVFEHTLAVEGLPQEPRLMVEARNRITGSIGLKLLWPCDHDIHVSDENEKSRHYLKLPYVCVSGPDWIEVSDSVDP